MTGISIVIPITDVKGDVNRQDLDNLLTSLDADHKEFTEIIGLFDSCEWAFIRYFQEKYPWLSAVINKGKALNFTKNANQGLKICHQQLKCDLVLVNQDCSFGGWMDEPKRLLGLRNRGISSAISANEFIPDSRFKENRAVKFEPAEKFAFYCTYISTEAMDKIGYLDEAFTKVFSDDDYCLRAHLAGLPVEIGDVFIHHRGSHLEGEFTESASGCYTGYDLGLGLSQYKTKWKCDEPHEMVINWALENYVWSEEFACR